jgi:N-methylhydantoinase A
VATSSVKRSVFDPALGRNVEAQAFERSALAPGARLDGPSVVTEMETTVVVPASRCLLHLSDGTLDVHVREDAV